MPRGRSTGRSSPSPPPPPRYQHRHTTVILAPQPQRGGFFRDVASTAAGVAIGSAVSDMLIGRHRCEDLKELPKGYTPNQPPEGPCAYQIQQFVRCAEYNEDLGNCKMYSDALKECKAKNGLP